MPMTRFSPGQVIVNRRACDITMRHIPRDLEGSGARFLNPTAKGSQDSRGNSEGMGRTKKIYKIVPDSFKGVCLPSPAPQPNIASV
jgi:hypothetical protein